MSEERVDQALEILLEFRKLMQMRSYWITKYVDTDPNRLYVTYRPQMMFVPVT